MSDILSLGTIVFAFAVALTAHIAIAYGLAFRAPRWRAVVALLVVPLAVYWALRERMWVRAGAWISGVAGYLVARLIFR